MIINNSLKRNSGFTLVELLVVISVVGILAGVTILIINPKKQRDVAEDGVRQSSMDKLILGIEAYASANGEYPLASEMVDADGNGKPDGSEAAVFIANLPVDPATGLPYQYTASSDRTSFEVSVPKATNSIACFKYLSAWGKTKECLCGSPDCVPVPTSAPVSTPTPEPTTATPIPDDVYSI